MSGTNTDPAALPGAPTMAPGIRAKMVNALYDGVYAKALPREEYDSKTAGLSDAQIADAAYRAHYKDKISQAEFNEKVGLKSTTSAADAVMRGATMGFSDELAATAMTGARTLGTLATGTMPTPAKMGAAYDQELRAERDKRAVYNQNNPYLGPALELAGGLMAGGPARIGGAAAKNIIAMAIPSRMQTVRNAAVVGGASGFGEGEGVEGRALGAGVGAGLGAGIGAAAPYAMQGVSMALGRAGKILGLGDSERVANQVLLKAFQDDGIPPDQITARLAEWQKAGAKPETLFDLGGENVRKLARTAAGRSGPGTEKAVTFLDGRQADQMRRALGNVEEGLGQSASDFHPTLQALDTQRHAMAAPKYEASFSRIVPTADEYSKLDRFVTSRNGQDALQRGLRIIEEEQVKTGIPFNPKQYGVVKNDQGQWTLETDKVPTLRLMDAVKRGYDNIIEGYRNPVTGRVELDQYGRAVEGNRAAYVKELRDLYPRYGGALDAWGGPSAAMDAASKGRNIFSMKDAEIATVTLNMRRTPADADAFRLGVAQAVRDQIARAPDGSDAVKRIFGSPTKKELLEAAFPDQKSFAAFKAQMEREASMFKKGKFVDPRTGSQTHGRGDDAETLADVAQTAGGALLTGAIVPGQSVKSAAGGIATNLLARGKGISPGVADSLVDRMFTSDPQAINRTAGLLSQADVDNALARIQSRRVGGLLLPGLVGGVNVAR